MSADGYIVGAYAATPSVDGWDPQLETAYWEGLAADPRIATFEAPWNGSLHAHDEQWLFQNLPDHVGILFTDVLRAIVSTRENPNYGLASRDTDGRALGLADAALLRDDVRRLNDQLGRRAVTGVELHSAPRASEGDAPSLAASLSEIAAWDWDGAELLIEHCDAQVPQHEPEKGFLALIDEISGIQASGTDVGLALNWGRSVVELRDADRAVEHVIAAREANLLRTYIVSGASDRNGVFDRPWVDAHNMFRRSERHPHGDPDSLLTDERVRDIVKAAGPDITYGVKLWWPPSVPGSVPDRIEMIRQALDTLDAAQTD